MMFATSPPRLVPGVGYSAIRCGARRSGIWSKLAILCAVILLSACSKVVTLQTGLNDQDANEIVMVLNRQGIAVEKIRSKEGVNLTVAEGELSRATAAMTAAGLPRRSISSLGEVFKKQGMISTPLEERVRYLHGLSEELGFTLQQFDNVVSARVHVVLPERIAPGEPVQPSSAAVFVKYRPPLDEDAVTPRIRRLVSAGIPGLNSEDGRSKVSVVLTPGEELPQGMQWTTVFGFQVEAGSATPLELMLYGLILWSILGTAGTGVFFFKSGGLKKKKKQEAQAPVAEADALAAA